LKKLGDSLIILLDEETKFGKKSLIAVYLGLGASRRRAIK